MFNSTNYISFKELAKNVGITCGIFATMLDGETSRSLDSEFPFIGRNITIIKRGGIEDYRKWYVTVKDAVQIQKRVNNLSPNIIGKLKEKSKQSYINSHIRPERENLAPYVDYRFKCISYLDHVSLQKDCLIKNKKYPWIGLFRYMVEYETGKVLCDHCWMSLADSFVRSSNFHGDHSYITLTAKVIRYSRYTEEINRKVKSYAFGYPQDIHFITMEEANLWKETIKSRRANRI